MAAVLELTLSNETYSVTGAAVEIVPNGLFAINDIAVIDNENGSFSIDVSTVRSKAFEPIGIRRTAGSYIVSGDEVELISPETFVVDSYSAVEIESGRFEIEFEIFDPRQATSFFAMF